MVTVIKQGVFYIEDKDVVEILKNTMTQCVHFELIKDYDNSIIVSVTMVPFYIQGQLSKNCLNVIYYNKHYVSTPEILLPFVGKEVSYYRDKSVFSNPAELFRIIPINFKFDDCGFKKVKLRDRPYFTNSGTLILPPHFVNYHFNHKVMLNKLSFDRTDLQIIGKGFIYVYMTPCNDKVFFSSKFKKTKAGLSAGPNRKLMELINKAGKKIYNFKYATTIKDVEFTPEVFIFKEIKYGRGVRGQVS